jgi:hypothetical protein
MSGRINNKMKMAIRILVLAYSASQTGVLGEIPVNVRRINPSIYRVNGIFKFGNWSASLECPGKQWAWGN